MPTRVRTPRGTPPASAQSNRPPASQPHIDSPLISDAKLRQLYSAMLRCRLLAERSSGAAGGAERRFVGAAAAAGAAIDLRPEDWIAPPPGDIIVSFLKGTPLAGIFPRARRGKEKPSDEANDPSLRSIVGAPEPAAQLNLACGVALALQAEKSGNVVMVFRGRSSTAEKQWQQALTFAAKHCLPLLVVERQASAKKASGSPRATPSNLLAEGQRCGLPVIPVDAHDVVAIYRVACESIHKARHGAGPTLIEARDFPALGPAKSSRKPPDAIAKMEEYLAGKGLFSESWKRKIVAEFDREVSLAWRAAKKSAVPSKDNPRKR